MLVMPPKERKRREREEYEKQQNEVIEGLLNNFDEETVEGDNLTIDNCAIAPLKEFKICGRKINQEIREGYNLANTNKIVSRTIDGIEVINNFDGSISLKGISTRDFSTVGIELVERININEENEGFLTVQVLGVPENSENGTINVYYFGVLKDKEVRSNNIDNGKTIRIELRCDLGAEIDCTIRPFIVKGSYTAETLPPYEAYGQSPSVNNSSLLESVGGNQEIKHNNENLVDVTKFAMNYPYGNVTYDEIKYGNGIILEYNKTNRIIHFHTSKKIEKNKKYYLKCNYTVLEGNETTKVVGGLLKVSQYVNINSVFTASEDTDTVSLYIDLSQWLEGTKVAITDIMFCESDVAPKKYIEHKSEIYPLDLTNKNLLPYPYTETSKKMNGIVWIDNKDGSITAKGIATQDSSFKLYGELSNQKIIKGKYLSGGKNSNEIIRIVTRQDNNYIILANCVGSSAAINLDAYQEGYIEIVIKAGTEVDTTFYPMISAFNTDVYEKYTEPYEYNLYSKNDYIYYDENLNKYFVHNEYEKIIADGINFKFTGKSGTANNNLFIIDNLEMKNKIKKYDNAHIADIYSNYFMKNSGNFLYSNNLQGIAIRVGGDIVIGFGLGSEIDTVEKANQFLMENTVELVYPLAVPTDTEITSKILIEQLDKLRKIMSYKGTNHFIVTSENGQSANLKAIVYKDTFKILKEEIDNLKALLLES